MAILPTLPGHMNLMHILAAACTALLAVDHSPQSLSADAQANREIKAELERLTTAAQAEEAKDASMAADVQQMRMEVAAKQASPNAAPLF